MRRIRDTVYIIGAGFSHGCGYPLTRDLLATVWGKLGKKERDRIELIIRFHHPSFDPEVSATFPNIETLLTEITVNIDLFDSSRRYQGSFLKSELESARTALLTTIAGWFHDIYGSATKTAWLDGFVQRIRDENAGVITFNWDLLLDHKLFGSSVSARDYGLEKELPEHGPFILKPHGSLNWYEAGRLKAVRKDRKRLLFQSTERKEDVMAFVLPRAIQSKTNKTYAPLIVAPTYLKDFTKPVFKHLWRHSTELLSTAKKIVFLGYSLPPDDLQARYILRCGFHNQLEGVIGRNKRRKATGNAEVHVVNPECEAVRRVKGVANRTSKVVHVADTVEEYLGSK